MESYLRISTWTFSLHFSSCIRIVVRWGRNKYIFHHVLYLGWAFLLLLLLSCKKVKVKIGLSGTAGPTPVHLLRPSSEVQLITFENTLFSNLPSLSSSSPALSHYNILLLQTSKYNHHYLRCAINHQENNLFNLHLQKWSSFSFHHYPTTKYNHQQFLLIF